MARPRARAATQKAAQAAALLSDTDPGKATRLFQRVAVETYSTMQKTGREYAVPLVVLACCELMGRVAAGAQVTEGRARSGELRDLSGYFADGVYRTWMGMAEGFDHAHFEQWRGTNGDSGNGAVTAHDGAGEGEPGAAGTSGAEAAGAQRGDDGR